METIMNIAKSLVNINKEWKVLRLDIQHYNHGYGISGYAGYLDYEFEGTKNSIRIHDNGDFEIND